MSHMNGHVCLLSSAHRQEITVSIVLISDMLMALLKADSLKQIFQQYMLSMLYLYHKLNEIKVDSTNCVLLPHDTIFASLCPLSSH